MGLWDTLQVLLRRDSAVPSHKASVAGKYRTPVVGESAYQRHLRRICGGRQQHSAQFTTTAVVVPEPTNLHDPNAVKIEIDGQTVGYLSRHDAYLYRARILQGTLSAEPRACNAMIRGGWDKGEDDVGMFGVFLDADFRPPTDQYPCPYCRTVIAPTPVRSQTCPQCGGKVAVRNGHPLTQSAAAGYDAIPGK